MIASLLSLSRNRIFGRLLPHTDIAGWIAMGTRRGARGQLLAAVALSLVLFTLLVLCVRPAQHSQASAAWSPPVGMLPPRLLPGSPAAEAEALGMDPAPLVGEAAAVRNANTPMMALGPSAKPYHFSGPLPDRMRARACLAAAMLFEAGDDGAGQLAVGQVVLNRARHPAFHGSVCGVILQGSERATGCQFTFTCDGALARSTTVESRTRALVRADMMLDGLVFAPVGLATHYHTVDVYPWWSPKLEKIARQGAHVFLRWPGHWGSARAVVDRAESEPASALFSPFGSVGSRDGLVSERQDEGRAEFSETAVLTRRSAIMAEQAATGSGGAVPAVLIPPSRRLDLALPHDTSKAMIPISTAALLGNSLIRMFPDEGVFFLQISSDPNEGRRRRVAEMLCGGRTDCRVYGWQDAASVPETIHIGPDPAAKLAFRFVKRPLANGSAGNAAGPF